MREFFFQSFKGIKLIEGYGRSDCDVPSCRYFGISHTLSMVDTLLGFGGSMLQDLHLPSWNKRRDILDAVAAQIDVVLGHLRHFKGGSKCSLRFGP